jgi:hypothetical protein
MAALMVPATLVNLLQSCSRKPPSLCYRDMRDML